MDRRGCDGMQGQQKLQAFTIGLCRGEELVSHMVLGKSVALEKTTGRLGIVSISSDQRGRSVLPVFVQRVVFN